jgi:hypothetical protein
MSPFLPHFTEAQKSEGFCFQSERLLYRREPNGGAEPGKQETVSCRTQELARSSAQENQWQLACPLKVSPERTLETDGYTILLRAVAVFGSLLR